MKNIKSKCTISNVYEDIYILEQRIGHKFNDIDHLNNAVTHSSYANEEKSKRNKIKSNERLEFLGDTILSMVISDYIFKNYPELPEGELTKIRSLVVCAVTLAKSSRELQLGDFLLLGKGEVCSGGRTRDSILADAFEAVIGAIYIDDGLVSASKFILGRMTKYIESSFSGEIFMDYKTELQERVQKNADKVEYFIIAENGPDHEKMFHAQVKMGKNVLGDGVGKTKKEAEQNAAQKALKLLDDA